MVRVMYNDAGNNAALLAVSLCSSASETSATCEWRQCRQLRRHGERAFRRISRRITRRVRRPCMAIAWHQGQHRWPRLWGGNASSPWPVARPVTLVTATVSTAVMAASDGGCDVAGWDGDRDARWAFLPCWRLLVVQHNHRGHVRCCCWHLHEHQHTQTIGCTTLE